MEKITDVLKELEKVTCRELAVYFDLTAPEMLARLLVLEREGKAQNLNGYWMPGGSTEPVAVTSKLTALDIKLLQSVPVVRLVRLAAVSTGPAALSKILPGSCVTIPVLRVS